MKFFKPIKKNGIEKKTKSTSKNIREEEENRLNEIKKKRSERRDKINNKANEEKNKNFDFMKEFEAIRKKGVTRKEFQKQERKEFNRKKDKK